MMRIENLSSGSTMDDGTGLEIRTNGTFAIGARHWSFSAPPVYQTVVWTGASNVYECKKCGGITQSIDPIKYCSHCGKKVK
jgi:rubrerythrin